MSEAKKYTRERKLGPYAIFYLALQGLVILCLLLYFFYTLSIKSESVFPRADMIINSAKSTQYLLQKTS
jgi:hypothetical protein